MTSTQAARKSAARLRDPDRPSRLTRLRHAIATPFRPLSRLGWSDLWILAGFSGVGYGLWQIHEPAAWIACGSLLMVYGLAVGGVSGRIDRRGAESGPRGAGDPR